MATSSYSLSANLERPCRKKEVETALHLMHAVSFNAAHLMRPRSLCHGFVLIGEEKGHLFFIGPRASIAAPEKEKIKCVLSY